MVTSAWSRDRPHRKSTVLLPNKDLEAGRPQLMRTPFTAPTWEIENVIVIIIVAVVVVVVVVVGNDTYYWVYLSSDHPFQVYYKVRQLILLQTATILEYKVRFIGITKCDRTNIYKFPDGTFQTELNSWSFASKPSLIPVSGVPGRFSVNGSDLYTMVM